MRNSERIIFMAGLVTLLTGCYRQVEYYPYQEPNQGLCREDVLDETFVHKYGVQVEENDWESRGKHGQVISTMKNGVQIKKSYQSGILEGDTTYSFPHSESIEKIESYSRGRLGRVLYHYRSGLPKQKIEYLPQNSRTLTTWYENGATKSVEELSGDLLIEGEYYTSNNQVESRVDSGTGHRVNRDEYGQLISLESLREGRVSQSETYHPNGTPKEIVTYQNGRMHGERKTFTPSGEPLCIEHWQDGYQHGLTTLFENGAKVAEIPYVLGMKDGVERRYGEGFEIVELIEWKNNTKHGASQHYVGANESTDWFYQGRKVTKSNFDQMNTWQAHS